MLANLPELKRKHMLTFRALNTADYLRRHAHWCPRPPLCRTAHRRSLGCRRDANTASLAHRALMPPNLLAASPPWWDVRSCLCQTCRSPTQKEKRVQSLTEEVRHIVKAGAACNDRAIVRSNDGHVDKFACTAALGAREDLNALRSTVSSLLQAAFVDCVPRVHPPLAQVSR